MHIKCITIIICPGEIMAVKSFMFTIYTSNNNNMASSYIKYANNIFSTFFEKKKKQKKKQSRPFIVKKWVNKWKICKQHVENVL